MSQSMSMAEHDISCESHRALDTEYGRIIEIRASGYYPPGPDHVCGGFILDYASKTVARENPTAVLFDLSELNYSGGNNLVSVLVVLAS